MNNDAAQPHGPAASSAASGAGAGNRITGGPEHHVTRPKRSLPWIVETALTVLVVLAVIGVFQTFIGRQYVIPSGSMEPTLHGCAGCTNDRIFAQKVSYYGDSSPQPGDVVVFEGTESWNFSYQSPRSANRVIAAVQEGLSFLSLAPPDENTLVKRVIAAGGQQVSCQEGDPAVMVDGQPIDQSYILQPPAYPVDTAVGSQACGGAYFGPITVPEGHYFMMGDNRTSSADSRFHLDDGTYGTIPEENIRGKVVLVFYPFNRFGTVEAVDLAGAH